MITDSKKGDRKLSTYDFVLKTGRDIYFAARDREIAILQDPAGGIRAEFADPVNACPVCGKNEFDCLFEKQGFQMMNCADTKRCGHVFANPQINDKALIEAYRGGGAGEYSEASANDLWIDVLLSEDNQLYDRQKYQRGLAGIKESLLSFPEGPPRILDIGCSVGHFLSAAKEEGWKTLGLELNERAIAHARDILGLEVRDQLLEEADLPDASFDAVTLWGVIEHLKHPINTLKEIVRVLKPGGILLTFCPNASSVVCRVLREKAATFDGRNHPSYFNPKSIRLAMTLAGLENISITFHQPNLDAVINHLDWKDPYVNRAGFPSELQSMISPHLKTRMEEFILENGLGYKMMTINRKPKRYFKPKVDQQLSTR